MKQKSQNRFLAALLAVAMMLQMLPMLAFADDAPGTGETYVAWNENQGHKGYPSLVTAVENASSGDTIILGEGNYTLYGISSVGTTKGKNLTFEGQGPDKTAWNIGAEVPDPSKYGTEYNGDYSFDGAGTVTFKNMTLRSGDADYLGFIRADQTVVDNCVINGKTFYWGYTSAVFTDTTFNAPSGFLIGDYAIWTYSSPTMTFDHCTFNATGKVINVYTDFGAGKQDITVNFNNCTVNSYSFGKQALRINDSNMGNCKYIININSNDPQAVKAARDTTTCSQVFGFGGDTANNTGRTVVYWNNSVEPVWKDGKMQTHSYTDGEHDHAFTTTYSEWTPIVERIDEREVTKKCDYCGWSETHKEQASVYRLQYNLNGGAGDGTADYSDAFSHENEYVTLEKAPTREGYQFDKWQTGKGDRYDAGDTLVLTGDEVFTAQWKKNEPVNTLTVTGGTFAVKKGDIDVTDTLKTSTDEAGKQTCLVPYGAEVTVTLDKTKVPEGMVFDIWSTGKFDLPLGQDWKAESITFTMKCDVDVAAQYRSADIEEGPDIVGPVIAGTAVVAGGAVLGYQAYALGTELMGKMWGLPYFPSNRSALAMMLWENAGKPMPESEILYPDVGQEERDMDLQHAARWAMEHDLLPDLNDQDTELPPEQVKFYPDNMITKINVLRAWKKAQDLKQNAQ